MKQNNKYTHQKNETSFSFNFRHFLVNLNLINLNRIYLFFHIIHLIVETKECACYSDWLQVNVKSLEECRGSATICRFFDISRDTSVAGCLFVIQDRFLRIRRRTEIG